MIFLRLDHYGYLMIFELFPTKLVGVPQKLFISKSFTLKGRIKSSLLFNYHPVLVLTCFK